MDGNKKTFEKENDELLNFILENRFFKPWREHNAMDKHSLWHDTSLELYITSACNLKCEYCYLQRHGEGLYPPEYRDPKKILANMRILLEHCLKEGFQFKNVEMFSGEVWHTEFGFELLELLLEYIQKGVRIVAMTIPTNCTFLLDETMMHRMQRMINRYKQAGTRLIISCSIEGKVLEDTTRPFQVGSQNAMRDDVFYDRLFTFAKHNDYLFHPMVASANVKDWIENLKWWENMLGKYEIAGGHPVMMLEVRNGDWTDESIKDLLKYYDYQLDKLADYAGHDAKKLSRLILKNEGESGYINYSMPLAQDFPGCTVANTMTVRLGDLAIVPCHRTSYDKLVFGKFHVTDGQIDGIVSNNPQMAIRTLCGNQNLVHHGCDICPYAGVCMKGCYGAQYEYAGDPFMPAENVCKMFKAKYDHLIDRYEEFGVIDEWRKVEKTDVFYRYINRLLECIDKIQSARGVAKS